MGTVNQENYLLRIAEALESISAELEELNDKMSSLSDCIGFVPPMHYQREGYYFLRIGGGITTE